MGTQAQEEHDEFIHNNLLEVAANEIHDIWSSWAIHLLRKCEDDDLGVVIPHYYAREIRQKATTPYARMSDNAKLAYRDFAEGFIAILVNYINTVYDD